MYYMLNLMYAYYIFSLVSLMSYIYVEQYCVFVSKLTNGIFSDFKVFIRSVYFTDGVLFLFVTF